MQSALAIILIVLSFDLARAKQFENCEFAAELYATHEVAREDIYKHLCIANFLHMTHVTRGDFLGIYAIGRAWWCGQDEPGGNCNVKCSDLLDDDIADDVACANQILQSDGLNAWRKSETECKQRYEHAVDECLENIDMLISLQSVMENVTLIVPEATTETDTDKRETTTVAATTTTSSTSTTTSSPISTTVTTTSTMKPATSTMKTTTSQMKSTTSTQWLTRPNWVFTTTSPRPVTQRTSTEALKAQTTYATVSAQTIEAPHGVRNTILTFLVLIMLVCLVAIFVRRRANQNRTSVHYEYENALIL